MTRGLAIAHSFLGLFALIILFINFITTPVHSEAQVWIFVAGVIASLFMIGLGLFLAERAEVQDAHRKGRFIKQC